MIVRHAVKLLLLINLLTYFVTKYVRVLIPTCNELCDRINREKGNTDTVDVRVTRAIYVGTAAVGIVAAPPQN